MTEPRYTMEDFDNTRFAAIKRSDGKFNSFFKCNTEDSKWSNYNGHVISISKLIKLGAFPVFPEPYSPEALKFAWEHAPEPTQEQINKGVGSLCGVSMTLNSEGSIRVKNDSVYGYFTPGERFLHIFEPKTREQEMMELLREELPEFSGEAIKKVVAAVDGVGDDLIDILER